MRSSGANRRRCDVNRRAAQEMPLEILFEDDFLAVLSKPAGMVVHPGAGHQGGTLVSGLLHHFGSLSQIGGVERPGIVHRLDKETSGCLVVAKTDPPIARSPRNSPGAKWSRSIWPWFRALRDGAAASWMRQSLAIR